MGVLFVINLYMYYVFLEFIKRGRFILDKLFIIVKKYDEMNLLYECICNNSNNLLIGCLIKKI